MPISVVVFIVGIWTFWTACVAQEASIVEKAKGTILQDKESTTYPTFYETQNDQNPIIINSTTPNLQGVGILSSSSKNPMELVKQFRSANKEILSDDYYLSSNFVFGMLSRNNWNAPAAIKSIKRIRLWRLSNNIAELGTNGTDPELLKLFPYQVTAVDKKGCPVLEIPGGKWLVADYMESKEFVREALKSFDVYTSQLLEKTRLANKRMMSKCNEAVILIEDASDFTFKNIAEPNALNAAVRFVTVIDSYYPNIFKTVIFVNANPDWANFINILKPYLGQTASQIKVFNDNEVEQAKNFMYNLVDPEQLAYKYFNFQGEK